VLEVPPDDVKAYGDAILRLCDDSALYESKRRGCLISQPQFYDLDRSWGAAVKRMLKQLRVEKSEPPRVAVMTETLPPRRMP